MTFTFYHNTLFPLHFLLFIYSQHPPNQKHPQASDIQHYSSCCQPHHFITCALQKVNLEHRVCHLPQSNQQVRDLKIKLPLKPAVTSCQGSRCRSIFFQSQSVPLESEGSKEPFSFKSIAIPRKRIFDLFAMLPLTYYLQGNVQNDLT